MLLDVEHMVVKPFVVVPHASSKRRAGAPPEKTSSNLCTIFIRGLFASIVLCKWLWIRGCAGTPGGPLAHVQHERRTWRELRCWGVLLGGLAELCRWAVPLTGPLDRPAEPGHSPDSAKIACRAMKRADRARCGGASIPIDRPRAHGDRRCPRRCATVSTRDEWAFSAVIRRRSDYSASPPLRP